jgi:hypothetical protein
LISIGPRTVLLGVVLPVDVVFKDCRPLVGDPATVDDVVDLVLLVLELGNRLVIALVDWLRLVVSDLCGDRD